MDYRSTLDSVSDSLDQLGQSLLVAAGALGDVLIALLVGLFHEVVAHPVGVALFVVFYLSYRFLTAGLGPAVRRERDRRYGVAKRPLDLMRHTFPGALLFLLGFGLFWWAQPTLLASLMTVPIVTGGFGLVMLGCYLYRRSADGALEAAPARIAPPPQPNPSPADAPRFVDPLEGIHTIQARRTPRVDRVIPMLRVAFPLGVVAAGLLVVFGALWSFSAAVTAWWDLERTERRAAVVNLDDSLGEAFSVLGDALRASDEPREQAQLPLP